MSYYNCAKSVLSVGLIVHARNFHSSPSKSTASITSRLAIGLREREGESCPGCLTHASGAIYLIHYLMTHKKQWGAMQLTGSRACACALPDNR